MELSLAAYLEQACDVLRAMQPHVCEATMQQAVDACVGALRQDKAILVCGNGGSAADASHIAGELVGRFLKDRQALRCMSLADNAAVVTAWANDADYESIFSRQVEAYGQVGGVLIAISTSGNSPNVLKAAQQAKAMQMRVIGMTGQGGGKLAPLCDALLDVPCKHTPHIQQGHVCLYHYLCGRIETAMAKQGA